VELLRSSKFSEVNCLKTSVYSAFGGIHSALVKTKVRYCSGHLDVFNHALTRIGTPFSAISFYLESVWAFYFNNFDWFSVVDFGHALNFDEFHKVPFLVGVAFVFVNSDHSVFILGDGDNYEGLSSLTIMVCYYVAVAVVQEGIASYAQSFTQNEANFVGSAELIDLFKIRDVLKALGVTYYIVVQVVFH